MPVVDTLVTRYVLNAEDYKKGAADIQASTGRLVSGFQVGLSAVKGLGVGLAGIAGSVLGLGGMAVKAASDWEVLNSQLAVVTGSFERAREVADFADKLALPSAFFDTKQLASAAKLLETMQLQTERYLPLVSTMASLFGASEESLMGFAAALGRLKAGSFGEAFERMREYGISVQDLMAEGLSFRNGQFQLLDGESAAQGADRALAAVEAVVKKRFGNMDAIMGDTMSAKFATFGETIQKSLRIAGQAITERLAGPFAGFVEQFGNFVNGPSFGLLAQKFASIIDFESLKKSAIGMFASIVAGFQQLPGIIKGVGGMLKNMWDVAIQGAILYASVQAGIISAQIITGLISLVSAFKATAGAAAAAAASSAAFQATLGNIGAAVLALIAGAATFFTLQKMMENAGKEAAQAAGFDINQWKADRDQIEREMSGAVSAPLPIGNPAASLAGSAADAITMASQSPVEGLNGQTSELSRQTGYLAAIERNTRPEGQTIMGGGSLAAMGVTPVELGTMSRGRGRLDQAVKLIAQYVAEEQAKSSASFLKSASPFIARP